MIEFINQYLPLKYTINDAIEIIIIAILIYYFLSWIKRTRAWNLFKGLLFLLVFILVAYFMNLSTILWIANKAFSVGVVAIIIVFQPELRKALESLGKNSVLVRMFDESKTVEEGVLSTKSIDELVKGSFELAKTKTGALMVIEQQISLDDYEKTGIPLDAKISSQLIVNIFEHNTPLHDGAVVIRGNTITAATCYLPLSDNLAISKELGTRHRAGLGVSEASDAFVIIVSEETGKVSVANGGTLYRDLNGDDLRNRLRKLESATPEDKKFGFRKGKHKNNERKAD